MPSLNEKLSEVQLLRLRATFHELPLFHLRTYILRTYARKNYATLEINPWGGGGGGGEGLLRVFQFSPLFKNQHFPIPVRPGRYRELKRTLMKCHHSNYYFLLIYSSIHFFRGTSLKQKQYRPHQFNPFLRRNLIN